MKPEELRIGNLVHATNSDPNGSLIEHVISNGGDIDNAHWFLPIRVNENWFERMGFRNTGEVGYYYIKLSLEMDMVIDVEGNVRLEYMAVLDSYYTYVHEIQNLYFALTKQELEIKALTT